MVSEYLKNLLLYISRPLPDSLFFSLVFIINHRYLPRFSKPRSLNEKINYIKLYNRDPLRSKITDRLWVRDYVEKKSEKCRLIKMIWSGSFFDYETWNLLPNRFVIKANHGSGMVRIVDKKTDTFESIQSLCHSWLELDYYNKGREWFYRKLKRYLVIEELLDNNGEVPPDFKFFCFNGSVEFVQVDFSRFGKHTRSIYDRDFQKIEMEYIYPNGPDISRPPLFDRSIFIAEELAQDFDFIRVDLYLLNGDVYFGELTNSPENGFGKIRPRAMDFKLGEKLHLNGF